MKMLILLLVLPTSALAAEEDCKEILRAGFFDEFTATNSQSRDQALYAELCASNFNQAKQTLQKAESSSGGGSVGVSYGLFSLNGGGGSSSASSLTEERFNEWKTASCSKQSTADSSRAAEFTMQKTVSEAVVNAWSSCMVQREGLNCFATPYDDDALLNISWKKNSLTQPVVTSSYLSKGAASNFDNVDSRKLLPGNFKLSPGGLQIPVTRDKSNSLVASLNVTHDGVGYSCDFYIPGMSDFHLDQAGVSNRSIKSPELGCKAQAAPLGKACAGAWSYAAPAGYEICTVSFLETSGPTEGASIQLADSTKAGGSLKWIVDRNETLFGAGRWVYGNAVVTYVEKGKTNFENGQACNPTTLTSN